jgi:hypothetical protein
MTGAQLERAAAWAGLVSAILFLLVLLRHKG